MSMSSTSGRRIAAALRTLGRRAFQRSAPEATSDPTPSAGAGHLATFDESVLDNLIALDGTGDALDELIGLFARDAGSRRAALASAAERGDAQGLRQAAHTIKGSAMNFGATRLSQLAAEVEGLARIETIADDQLITMTCHELDEAVRFLLSRTNRSAAEPTPEPRD